MQKIIFPTLIFLTPIFFLSNTSNFFATPKQILILVSMLLLLIYSAYQIFITHSVSTNRSPLTYALLAFALATIANIAFTPLLRTEAIAGPGILYLSLCTIGYFLSLDGSNTLKKNIILAFVSSSTILAVHTLAQLTFLYKSSFLPVFMQSRAFTLTGSLLSTLIIVIIATTVSVYLAYKHEEMRLFYSVTTILSFLASIALLAILLPGGELAITILPLRASWSMALDAMKSPRSFFIGVGLVNFPAFYSTVKPLFLNTTSFWNTIPGSSSSELLNIMTTMGVLGLGSFLALPILTTKHSRSVDHQIITLKIMASLSFLALLLTPASIPVLLVFFVSIALLSSKETESITLSTPGASFVSLLILVVVGTISFYGSKILMAEMSLRKAQAALTTNDGKTLYENSLKVVQLVPQMASYRLSYSQVNLSLATALSQKENLTDTEKENVTTLVSQAVREAKAAVSLSPNSSIAWQNLGNIYQQLINVAQDSDQFAVEAYARAVALDPASPALRIEYGGLLYQLGGLSKDKNEQARLYTLAQNEFQTAIQLKPDYPNAYYNLAKLLETAGDYTNASTLMQKAISLLGPDNPNLGKANSELEAIKAKVPKTKATTPTKATEATEPTTEVKQEVQEEKAISTPAPLPEPLDGGPIDISSATE